MQRRAWPGYPQCANILRSAAPQMGSEILHNLSRRDQTLAEKLGPGGSNSTTSPNWTAPAGPRCCARRDSAIAVLALVGAPPELIGRALERLPSGEAQIIRRQLDNPGPIRLRDVEQARQELADVARRLVTEGRLSLDATGHQLPLGAAA